MHSALYLGSVSHCRLKPKVHAFTYRAFMMYLDIDELESVLNLTSWWSNKWWSLARFKRKDFHGNEEKTIKESIYETVLSQTGIQLVGPVRVLNNWRYFGFNMNPLSTYYCFDESGEKLQCIVAEVTNTPWHERYAYVLDCRDQPDKQIITFVKDFSVSPFYPLNMNYKWMSSTPSETLTIHLQNFYANERVFNATLRLSRKELSSKTMRGVLIAFPWMTVKVMAAIYWEALRLWLKGVPFLGKNAKQ